MVDTRTVNNINKDQELKLVLSQVFQSEAPETRDMLSGEALRREAFPWTWRRTLSTFQRRSKGFTRHKDSMSSFFSFLKGIRFCHTFKCVRVNVRVCACMTFEIDRALHQSEDE